MEPLLLRTFHSSPVLPFHLTHMRSLTDHLTQSCPLTLPSLTSSDSSALTSLSPQSLGSSRSLSSFSRGCSPLVHLIASLPRALEVLFHKYSSPPFSHQLHQLFLPGSHSGQTVPRDEGFVPLLPPKKIHRTWIFIEQ